MKARLLVLGVLLVLLAASLAACSLGGAAPTATPKIVEVTKVVEKPVTQIVEKQVTVVVQATAAPQPTAAAQPTAAPQATAAPKPVAPTVQLQIMDIPANPANVNAITGTMTYVTSTQAGPAKATVAMGQTGLDNVSLGVPVSFTSVDLDAKNPSKKWTWTLTAPPGSKSTLAFTNTVTTKFTPDLVGVYRVLLTAANDAGNAAVQGVQVHADMYVGADKGSCKTCHPNQASDWAKTGHATALATEVSGGADPANTHFNETCIRCHTTGWAVDATGKAIANKGFADVQAQTGWKYPTYAEMASQDQADLGNHARRSEECVQRPVRVLPWSRRRAYQRRYRHHGQRH